MAILQQPANTSNPFRDVIGDALAPVGTFVARIIDIRDEFGIVRTKYQSTETEKVDLTTFLFGFRDDQNNPHKVASRQMRISGSEKSALFGFLKSLLGRAPQFGWDYCTLKGSKVLLTVEHVQRKDGSGVFAGIASLSPVPAGFGQPAPQPVASPPAPAPAPAPQPAVPAPAPAPEPAPAPQPKTPSVAPVPDDEVSF